MLLQHLVVVTSADGAETHYPLVCRSSELLMQANRVFHESGGVRADVWRGADRLYALERSEAS